MFVDQVMEAELDLTLQDVPLEVLEQLEKYNEGHSNGLVGWPDHWEGQGEPGGPWIYDGQDREAAARSRLMNQLWRQGWRDGHREKLEGKRKG